MHIEEPKISSDGASTGIDEHGKPHLRAQLDPPGMNRDLKRDLEGNSLERSLERSLEHSLEQHLEQQAGFLSDEEVGGGDSHASRPEASPLPEVTRAANPYYHDDQARTSAAESTREGTSLRGRERGLRQLFVHIWFSFIKSPQWSFLVTSPTNRAWMNGASRAGWESTREAARKRRRPHWLSYSARCSSLPSLLSMRCVRPLNGRTVSEPHISPRARYSATRWRRGGEMKMMHSKRSLAACILCEFPVARALAHFVCSRIRVMCYRHHLETIALCARAGFTGSLRALPEANLQVGLMASFFTDQERKQEQNVCVSRLVECCTLDTVRTRFLFY